MEQLNSDTHQNNNNKCTRSIADKKNVDIRLEEFQSIEVICKLNSSITFNQLRWIAANKERYKISHAIKRIGRKLYFHVPSLTEWINTQNA